MNPRLDETSGKPSSPGPVAREHRPSFAFQAGKLVNFGFRNFSKFLLREFGKHLRLVCDTTAVREKAAVNAPQSKRFANVDDAGPTRQRMSTQR